MFGQGRGEVGKGGKGEKRGCSKGKGIPKPKVPLRKPPLFVAFRINVTKLEMGCERKGLKKKKRGKGGWEGKS